MDTYIITQKKIAAFGAWLRREERAENTVTKYMHDLQKFALWADGRAVTKELVSQWKAALYTSALCRRLRI